MLSFTKNNWLFSVLGAIALLSLTFPVVSAPTYYSIGDIYSQPFDLTGKFHATLAADKPAILAGADIATLTGVTISNADPSVLTKDATIDDGLAVGDIVQVNSGTNATVGTYVVKSIVANTSVTLDRQAATGACTDGNITYTTGEGLTVTSTGQMFLNRAGANSVTVDSSGRVGIRTSTPRAPLEINGDVLLNNGKSIRALDTSANINDIFQLWTDNNIYIGANTNTVDTYIRTGTGNARFTFGGAEKVTVLNSGNVGIGTAAPAAQLHIDQASTTAAKPVLTIDQADVSEELIRIIGTSANGVLTQSIVENADVGAPTLQGWLKIYVQDDGDQLTDQAYFVPIYTLAAP